MHERFKIYSVLGLQEAFSNLALLYEVRKAYNHSCYFRLIQPLADEGFPKIFFIASKEPIMNVHTRHCFSRVIVFKSPRTSLCTKFIRSDNLWRIKYDCWKLSHYPVSGIGKKNDTFVAGSRNCSTTRIKLDKMCTNCDIGLYCNLECLS